MDEKIARQERIDEQLRLAGWDTNDPSQVSEEHIADLAREELVRAARRPEWWKDLKRSTPWPSCETLENGSPR